METEMSNEALSQIAKEHGYGSDGSKKNPALEMGVAVLRYAQSKGYKGLEDFAKDFQYWHEGQQKGLNSRFDFSDAPAGTAEKLATLSSESDKEGE